MVIFGATGDLTKRKLFPALYNLAREKHLPSNFAIVGVGRQEMESAEFRRQMHDNLKEFAGADGGCAPTMLAAADRAMYDAKAVGGGRVRTVRG